MKSYADIMDLVSDDDLWAKKGQLVASTLYTRTQIHNASDQALVQMFTENTTVAVMRFQTQTGREGRVLIAVGEDACREVDADYGEDTE